MKTWKILIDFANTNKMFQSDFVFLILSNFIQTLIKKKNK